MSVRKHYPKITKMLLYINHNRKKGFIFKKNNEYFDHVKNTLDLDDYYEGLIDDKNYG